MSNPLMELIASGEGDYNSYNGGTYKDKHGKDIVIPANQTFDFAQMSIADIQRHQALPRGHHDRVFAVGKYQFITTTLADAVSKLHIDPSEKFTPEFQDKLFNDYSLIVKRKEVHAYITGMAGATLHDAQIGISKEWASVEDPDTPGHVRKEYEKHGNKMHTTAAQVGVALDEMRQEYQAQLAKGLSQEQAWTATANMGPGSFRATVHERDSTVRTIQQNLQQLDIPDAEGRALVPDNHAARAPATPSKPSSVSTACP